jgi:hypothetical protein
MNAQYNLVNDIWLWLRSELLADRRKTAVMGTLVVVAFTIGLRIIISGTGPHEATAAQPAPPVVAASNASGMAPPASRPDRSEVATYLEQIDSTVSRDLFATDYGVYPMAQVKPMRPESAGPSRTDAQDAALRELARHDAFVHAVAQKLVLQSTMPGDPPTAIINGQVVQPGETFMDFEVREIELGSCVVAHGTIEVTLSME